MRTSGTVMTAPASTSSSISPRANSAASAWRTSSPTRSMRWDGPVGRCDDEDGRFIGPSYASASVSSTAAGGSRPRLFSLCHECGFGLQLVGAGFESLGS